MLTTCKGEAVKTRTDPSQMILPIAHLNGCSKIVFEVRMRNNYNHSHVVIQSFATTRCKSLACLVCVLHCTVYKIKITERLERLDNINNTAMWSSAKKKNCSPYGHGHKHYNRKV